MPSPLASFGRSRVQNHAPIKLSGRYEYWLSPRDGLMFNVMAGRTAPSAEAVFRAPQYYNLSTGAPAVKFVGGEAGYRLATRTLKLNASLFASATADGSRRTGYWDDLEELWCDMIISRIDKRRIGAEVAAELEFSPSFTFKSALSGGRYRYGSDPTVYIYEEAWQMPVEQGLASRVSGLALPSSPELLLVETIDWHSRSGIWSTLSLNYMAGRYVDPAPLRRLARTLDLASNSEAMSRQEQLPAAATLDLTVYKSFRTRLGAFDLFLVVNNLLNNRNIVYNAYEPSRLVVTGDGSTRSCTPFPTEYLYAYPRTYYLRLGYRF
jgi:hypothetical protein